MPGTFWRLQGFSQLRRSTAYKSRQINSSDGFTTGLGGDRRLLHVILTTAGWTDQDQAAFLGRRLRRIVKSPAWIGLALISPIAQQILQEDFENLSSGSHAIFALELIDHSDQLGRELDRNGFRLGFLFAQRFKRASGRLSSQAGFAALLLAVKRSKLLNPLGNQRRQ